MSIQYLYPFNLFKNAALPKLFTDNWLNAAVDEELPHNGESTPTVNPTGRPTHATCSESVLRPAEPRTCLF